MCGRFTINLTYDELDQFVQERYKIDKLPAFDLPRFNIAPSTNIISVIHDGKKNRIGELKWGFMPSFDTERPLNLINAKAETVFSKPTFKEAAYNRRCVIIADSFYEWNQYDKKDNPRRIMRKNNQIFSMAGIWNAKTNQDGTKTFSVAIITVESNSLMKPIHDRMPAILDEASETVWLDTSVKDKHILQGVLIEYPSELMKMYKVSKNVNSPKNNDASLLLEVDDN